MSTYHRCRMVSELNILGIFFCYNKYCIMNTTYKTVVYIINYGSVVQYSRLFKVTVMYTTKLLDPP